MKSKKEKHQHTRAAEKGQEPAVKKKASDTLSTGLKRSAFILLALIGFLVYSNTLNHGYVLDDFSVIKDNKLTTQGLSAMPQFFKTGLRDGNFLVEDNLYRPITKTVFAAEWQIAPDQPAFAHFVNVISYAFLCGFFFLLLLKLFPGRFYLAFISALVFAVHPIHTEVVANIKSIDEILALMMVFLSMWFAHDFARGGKAKHLLAASLIYLLALFTKENAITFLVLVPLTMYFFTDTSFKRIGTVFGVMGVFTVMYLMIHKSVIGMIGVDNVPVVDNSLFVTQSFGEQRMTAIYILGLYLKLLLVPHPLSCDYSYNTIPIVSSAAHAGFIISLFIHGGLFVYALLKLKSKNPFAYAILFYLISLSVVSNVFVLIGTNMGERLLFAPSVGFVLAVGLLVERFGGFISERELSFSKLFSRLSFSAILLPVLFAFSYKTIDRNRDWKSDNTLFEADVKTVPNSAHMLYYHAGMIAKPDSLKMMSPDQKMITLQKSEQELLKALQIWEPFPNVHGLIARIYKDMGNYDKAIFHYNRTLSLNNNDPTAFNNLATCYFETGRLPQAEFNFKKAVEISPICYADAMCNLGSVYGTMGEINLQQGKQDSAKIYFDRAIGLFNQTLGCDASYENAYKFLGFTYRTLGDSVKFRDYMFQYDQVVANNAKAKAVK